MVSGDRIPEQGQHPGGLDVGNDRQGSADVVEERRVLNVGRVLLPHVGSRLRHFNGLPLLVPGKHLGVFLVEHRGADLRHGIGDLFLAGPDVAQVDRLAILAHAQRLAADVRAHTASQRISHHQGRRGEPVGFHQRVNTAFEVAVARQHGSHGQVVLGDGFFNGFRQRPGVADTSRAAVAHQ